jgi:hypothetical protein
MQGIRNDPQRTWHVHQFIKASLHITRQLCGLQPHLLQPRWCVACSSSRSASFPAWAPSPALRLLHLFLLRLLPVAMLQLFGSVLPLLLVEVPVQQLDICRAPLLVAPRCYVQPLIQLAELCGPLPHPLAALLRSMAGGLATLLRGAQPYAVFLLLPLPPALSPSLPQPLLQTWPWL